MDPDPAGTHAMCVGPEVTLRKAFPLNMLQGHHLCAGLCIAALGGVSRVPHTFSKTIKIQPIRPKIRPDTITSYEVEQYEPEIYPKYDRRPQNPDIMGDPGCK